MVDMKKSLVCTAVLSAILILTGCGSDNNSANNTSQGSNNNGNNNQNSDLLTEEQKQVILDTAKETSSITLKESLLSGIVDTLVFGTDEAVAGEECSSGNYTKTDTTITFTDCNGLFKAATDLNQYENLTAKSGKVTIKNGEYQYQDLVLINTVTGESKTATGSLKMTGDDNSAVISIENIIVKATEKNGVAFADVNYTLEDYQLNYDKKNSSELALAVGGTLSVVNSAVGDYKIKFETTQPLLIQIDSRNDDEVVTYPYDGTIKIEDLNNKAVTTLTANTDKKTVRYSITVNGKEIENGTQNWTDILGYSK